MTKGSNPNLLSLLSSTLYEYLNSMGLKLTTLNIFDIISIESLHISLSFVFKISGEYIDNNL